MALSILRFGCAECARYFRDLSGILSAANSRAPTSEDLCRETSSTAEVFTNSFSWCGGGVFLFFFFTSRELNGSVLAVARVDSDVWSCHLKSKAL